MCLVLNNWTEKLPFELAPKRLRVRLYGVVGSFALFVPVSSKPYHVKGQSTYCITTLYSIKEDVQSKHFAIWYQNIIILISCLIIVFLIFFCISLKLFERFTYRFLWISLLTIQMYWNVFLRFYALFINNFLTGHDDVSGGDSNSWIHRIFTLSFIENIE